MRKAGLAFLWVGVVLGVVCVPGGVALAIWGFTHMGVASEDDVLFGAETSVELKAGQKLAVYVAEDDDAGPGLDESDDSNFRAAECTVTGPNGAKGAFGGAASSTITRYGAEWQSKGSFTAPSDGRYSVTCTDEQRHLLNEPIRPKGIFGGVGGVFLAVLGGRCGVIFFIVGLVLWASGRRAERARVPRYQ